MHCLCHCSTFIPPRNPSPRRYVQCIPLINSIPAFFVVPTLYCIAPSLLFSSACMSSFNNRASFSPSSTSTSSSTPSADAGQSNVPNVPRRPLTQTQQGASAGGTQLESRSANNVCHPRQIQQSTTSSALGQSSAARPKRCPKQAGRGE